MKRRALRFLLASGYCMLLTVMLLYQAGAFGGRRDWAVASLGTLLLGAALAVVLVLYVRVNDQIRKEEEPKEKSESEIYADFLRACDGHGLSERELEVAWLLYKGRTNRQIGEELFIAETTVKKHVTHIYEKMQVYCRKDFRAMVNAGKSSHSHSVG